MRPFCPETGFASKVQAETDEEKENMRVYLCVDDTDDITKRTSTGAVAEQIGKALVQKGAVLEEGITRHQLLLHPDIRYTSHNSAMCLVMQVEENGLSRAQVTAVAREIVQREQAESADPGLALCWGEPEQGRQQVGFGNSRRDSAVRPAEGGRHCSGRSRKLHVSL